MTVLNRSVRYPGVDCAKPTVEEAKATLKAATGHEVPAHILEEFAAALMPGIDPDTALEARLRRQNDQLAREDRERLAARKVTRE